MRVKRFFPFVVAFVAVCLAAGLVSFASATVILSDGFESGNFSAWTGVKDYSPIVVSDVVHDGSYAAFCNDTGIRVCYKEVTPANHLFIRAYYKFGAMSAEWAIHGLGYFVEDDMVQIVAMFEIAHFTGSTYIWRIETVNGIDSQSVESSGFTLDVNRWYCMELEMFVDGSAGYVRLYVDNVLVASLEGVDNDYYGPIGRAGVGQVGENRNNEPIWWDCCVIADSYIGLEQPISHYLLPTPVTLYQAANITQNSLRLSWTQNTDVDFKNYTIYRSITTEAIGTAIAAVTSNSLTSYDVTELSANTTYYFMIRVYDTEELHADSNRISATSSSAPSETSQFPLVPIVTGSGIAAIAIIFIGWSIVKKRARAEKR